MKRKVLISIVVLGFFVLAFIFMFFNSSQESPAFWKMNIGNKGYSNVTMPESSVIEENFGVGLFENPNYETGAATTWVFMTNGTFEKYLFIANGVNRSREYLVTVLIDYVQVPFYLDGKADVIHLVTLNPMEYKFFKIKLENISEGYHDVFIGVFLDPYNHNLSDRYRLSTDFSLMGGVRIQVISGSPIYRLPNFSHPPIVCDKQGAVDGIILTKKPCRYKAWLREPLSKDINYYINIGETTKNMQTFALVALIDYKQVPISNTSLVYFGYTYKNWDIAIPAELSINTNDSETVHEFVVLYFTEPFLPIQFPPKVKNINLNLRYEPSIRVAIVPDNQTVD